MSWSIFNLPSSSLSLMDCSLSFISCCLLLIIMSPSSLLPFRSISLFLSSKSSSSSLLSCCHLSFKYSMTFVPPLLFLPSLSTFSLALVSPILSIALFLIDSAVALSLSNSALFLFSQLATALAGSPPFHLTPLEPDLAHQAHVDKSHLPFL